MDNEAIQKKLWLELERRCKLNPRYSLRAFARYLDIEPSALSKIMRGKRVITSKTRAKFAKSLDWATPPASEKIPAYEVLDNDIFAAMGDWYYYAILELTHTKDFQANPRYVASRLGLSLSEVNSAVERLKRLGLLQITPQKQWLDTGAHLSNRSSGKSTLARRNLQKQILQQAQLALEEVPYDLRLNTSMTLAINSKRLDSAKEKIRKFLRDITTYLQEGERDELYQISMAMFPLSKKS